MNDETLKLRGRLAVNMELLDSIRRGIDVDIDEARDALDRWADKLDLKEDRIEIVATRLVGEIRKYKKLHAQIAEMKKDLGE